MRSGVSFRPKFLKARCLVESSTIHMDRVQTRIEWWWWKEMSFVLRDLKDTSQVLPFNNIVQVCKEMFSKGLVISSFWGTAIDSSVISIDVDKRLECVLRQVLMKIKNRVGPGREFCGTPALIPIDSEDWLLITTFNDLLHRKDLRWQIPYQRYRS